MTKKLIGKAKKNTVLWWIGFWATAWWGVTCFYILLVIWQAVDYYVQHAGMDREIEFFSEGKLNFGILYYGHNLLTLLAVAIVTGWVCGGLIWLRELKRQKISYGAALKDLFLTLRK